MATLFKGSLRNSHESVPTLVWETPQEACAYLDFEENDQEILKASVMLHSTLTLLKKSRRDQYNSEKQLKTFQERLNIWERERDSLKRALQKSRENAETERQSLKHALEKAEKLAEDSLKQYEKLQAILEDKVHEGVATRLKEMLDTCMDKKGNSKALLYDVITQVYQDTQAEKPFKLEKAPYTTPRSKRAAELSSPDVILDTPDTKVKGKRFRGISKSGTGRESDKSSSQKEGKVNIFGSLSLKQTVNTVQRDDDILAKDTQDDKEAPVKKTVLRENMVIPETLPTEVYEDATGARGTALILQGKENNRALSSSSSGDTSLCIADLSTDVEFPLTPEKKSIPKHDKGSPILIGSGSKKTSKPPGSVNRFNSSSPSLLDDRQGSQLKLSKSDKISKVILDSSKYDVKVEKTPKGLKRLKQSKLSKLSLSKVGNRNTDISTFNEFNGGQRSSSDLGVNVLLLDEKQQMLLAMENSLKDNLPISRCELPDDSDATLFEPARPEEHGSVQGSITSTYSLQNVNREDCKTISSAEKSDGKHGIVFEPVLASTAKEEFGPQKKTTGLKETDTQFNPPFASTMIHGNGSSPLSQALFNPLCASTEADVTPNTHLLDMVKNIDANETLITSYDRVPRKGSSPEHAYRRGAVRKKADRMKLKGWDCEECAGFYIAAGHKPGDTDLDHVINKCSRHRDNNGLRPSSPEGYWRTDFPSTQSVLERQMDYSP